MDVYFVCWGPFPGLWATGDTGEFSFTLQPPKRFQNDLNPTGVYALLVKDKMRKGTDGDNPELPGESLCGRRLS